MSAALRAGAVFAVVIAVWQAIVWFGDITPFILPGPGRVAVELWENAPMLGHHALITGGEVVAGIALGALLGGITALSLVASPGMAKFSLPVLVFSQSIPFFALAPILVLWFGFGMASKIVMALLIIYFPVTSAFYDGLKRTDPGLLDLARVMGATPRAVLWRLRVPAAMPAFASGLRLAAVYAPIGAVIGEWTGGASGGLGYLMHLANGRAKVDLMFAAIFVLSLFTVALYAAISRLGVAMEAYAAGKLREN
ncbi:MAG: ABC transporter permease [Pseudomonadota bacterium]